MYRDPKSIFYLAALVLIGGLMGCSKASAGTTQWQGLCIPSARVVNVSGGVWGKIFNQANIDKPVAPTILLNFSSEELAEAILGYTPKIPGHVGTIMGSTVTLQPLTSALKPGGYAHLSQGIKDLWYLQGDSKNSSVQKVPGTDLYRVTAPENQKYDSYFELVTVDLRQTAGKPVPPLKDWYVADCAQSNELGYTCNRHLITTDFYVQYSFAKPNVTKLAELDTFFENKLKLWAEACAAQ